MVPDQVWVISVSGVLSVTNTEDYRSCCSVNNILAVTIQETVDHVVVLPNAVFFEFEKRSHLHLHASLF